MDRKCSAQYKDVGHADKCPDASRYRHTPPSSIRSVSVPPSFFSIITSCNLRHCNYLTCVCVVSPLLDVVDTSIDATAPEPIPSYDCRRITNTRAKTGVVIPYIRYPRTPNMPRYLSTESSWSIPQLRSKAENIPGALVCKVCWPNA